MRDLTGANSSTLETPAKLTAGSSAAMPRGSGNASPRGALFKTVLAGPAVVMAAFLAHCALFMNLPEGHGGQRWAWSHLPLDDAWIHLGYAKYLLSHGYITYNPGQIETGATSPLWVVLLAAGLALLRHPVLAAKAVGIILGALCVGLTFHELRRIGGRVAAWTGALLLVLDPMWIMSTVSGMEIPLAALLLMLLVRQVRLARPAVAGVIMGLLVLARPDTGPPAALAGLLLLGVWWRRHAGAPNRWAAVARNAALCAGVAAIFTLPWFLYCRLGTGLWLPCTFYVKGQSYVYLGWDKLKTFVSILEHGLFPSPFLHDPLGLALLAAGIAFAFCKISSFKFQISYSGIPHSKGDGPVGLRDRIPHSSGAAALALLLLPLTHVVFWTLLVPYMTVNAHPGEYLTFIFTRYYVMDYPPVFALIGFGAAALSRGVLWLGARLETGLAPRADLWLRRAIVSALVLSFAAGNYFGWWDYIGKLWLMGKSYRYCWYDTAGYNVSACRNIYEIHERMGRWIEANVPPQAVIATQDAGAIRYFASHRLVDLWGLNSHRYFFAPDKPAFLRREGVSIAVVFTPGRLDPLYDFKTRRTLAEFSTAFPNRISEGEIMAVREIE